MWDFRAGRQASWLSRSWPLGVMTWVIAFSALCKFLWRCISTKIYINVTIEIFAFQLFTLFISGFCSNVCDIKPLKAAHLSEVDGGAVVTAVEVAASIETLPLFASFPLVDAAICARFFANLSRSPLSTFSLLFMAPGLLFMLFRRMMLTCSSGSLPATLLPT